MTENRKRLSLEELEAEQGTQLPDKEVVSLLDLFVNVDLALDLAAPIDLAIAANANAALPIDAAVTANLLSLGSTAQALSLQDAEITQGITGDSVATAPQTATIDQSNDVVDEGTTAQTASATSLTPDDQVVGVTTEPVGDVVDTDGGTVDGATDTVGDVGDTVGDTVGDVGDATNLVDGVTGGGLLDDGLLNVNVDVALDADLAAPVAGAVAAQANVAAPIDASVAANIASVDSTATAIAQQTAVINQTIDGNATATAEQDAEITQ
jgi:hypothetical protein